MNKNESEGASGGSQYERDVLLGLLQDKKDEGKNLVTHYIRAGIFYAVAVATILKFAYDSNSTVDLRRALLAFGAILSFLGLIMASFGELLRRRIESDIQMLTKELKAPVLCSDLLSLKLTVYIFIAFVMVILLGGVVLLPY